MKKALTILFIFLFSAFVVSKVAAISPTPTTGPRFAACDLCGYCPPNNPPGNWSACQQCLYPNANPDPASFDTLKVDAATNLPIKPTAGRQYTFLGCLTTGEGSFQEGGAGSVVQSLLKTVFSIVGGVAFLYLIYGAFVIASSQNDPEKLNYGRRVIYGAIMGLVFSLTSVLLVNLIAGQVLKIPGFGNGGVPAP
ncbi:MAG: hypothetical protein ACOYUB_04730 [Patescibacteria group bacterium]